MRRQVELGRYDCDSADDECGVDQLTMTGRPPDRGKSRPVGPLIPASGRLQNKCEMKSIL
jgi:hypothetical protein